MGNQDTGSSIRSTGGSKSDAIAGFRNPSALLVGDQEKPDSSAETESHDCSS